MPPELNTDNAPLSVNDAAQAILAFAESNGSTDEEVENIAEETTEEEESEVVEDVEEESEEESEEEESEDTEEGEEEEESPEESDEDDYIYEVTVKDEDGEDVVLEVEEDELLNGYMRQRDYTRKRQAEKAEVDELKTTLNSQINEYTESLSDLVTDDQIKLAEYAQVDWNALKAKDLDAFNTHYSAALELNNRVQTNQAKLAKIKEEANTELVEAQSKYLKEQKELVKSLIPDWETEKGNIESYLKSEGFDDQELHSVSNAKIAVLADKAKKYDELKRKQAEVGKKKIAKKVPKMVKPGTPTSETEKQSKVDQKAMDRLKGSGSLNDAAALLYQKFK